MLHGSQRASKANRTCWTCWTCLTRRGSFRIITKVITNREMRDVCPQAYPDRQFGGRDPPEGSARAPEGRKRLVGVYYRNAEWLRADALRSGACGANRGGPRVHAGLSGHVSPTRQVKWRWIDRRAL